MFEKAGEPTEAALKVLVEKLGAPLSAGLAPCDAAAEPVRACTAAGEWWGEPV